MSVLLATGHHGFDKNLMDKLQTTLKVDYLEEIEFAIYSNKIQTIILSEYIPTLAAEDDEKQKHQSLLSIIELLRKNRIRVIFLTSMDAPKWLLGRCVTLGVYDLVLTDGNINLDIIMSFFFNPSTAAQAKTLLGSLQQHDHAFSTGDTNNRDSEIEINQNGVIGHSQEMQFDTNQSFSHKFLVDQDQYETVNHPFGENPFGDNIVMLKSKPKGTSEFTENEYSQEKQYNYSPQSLPEHEVFWKETFESHESQAADRTGKITPFHPNITEKTIKPRKIDNRILAFWSPASGMGSRTVAQTFANLITERGADVLYVELDYFNPSFAATSGLSHPTKNMLQYALQSIGQDDIDVESFIAMPSEVPSNRKSVRKTVEMISDKLNFLAFPKGFKTENFPVIEDNNFISTFIKGIKATRYDYIILNLPHQIENVFTFPIMLESDVTFNVMNLHPARILKYFQVKETLMKTPFDFGKMKLVVNKAPEEMKMENIEAILNDKCAFIIPYCPHRVMNELDLVIGSPAINDSVGEFLSNIGLEEENEPKERKRRFFGLRE